PPPASAPPASSGRGSARARARPRVADAHRPSRAHSADSARIEACSGWPLLGDHTAKKANFTPLNKLNGESIMPQLRWWFALQLVTLLGRKSCEFSAECCSVHMQH